MLIRRRIMTRDFQLFRGNFSGGSFVHPTESRLSTARYGEPSGSADFPVRLIPLCDEPPKKPETCDIHPSRPPPNADNNVRAPGRASSCNRSSQTLYINTNGRRCFHSQQFTATKKPAARCRWLRYQPNEAFLLRTSSAHRLGSDGRSDIQLETSWPGPPYKRNKFRPTSSCRPG